MTGEINGFRTPFGITANVIKSAGADTLKRIFVKGADGEIVKSKLIPTSEIKAYGTKEGENNSIVGKTIFAFLKPEATMEDAKKAFDEAEKNLDYRA